MNFIQGFFFFGAQYGYKLKFTKIKYELMILFQLHYTMISVRGPNTFV